MKNNTLKWLYTVPGQKKWYVVILAVIQTIHAASGVVYAILLRDIVDSATNNNHTDFWKYVSLIVILVLVQIMLSAIIRWLNEYSKATFENIFKQRMVKNILNKDYEKVSAVHSGEWLNRITNDTVVIANNYVEIIPGLIGMIVKIISATIMMITIDWKFACILIPGGVIVILLTFLFRKKLKKLHKKMQEKDGQLRIFLQENISSLLMIRSFAAEKQTENESYVKMQEHKKSRMNKNRFSNICNIGFGTAMNGMYLFGVCYCGYRIMLGAMSFGTLTAIVQLITQIQSPFANITGYLPRFYAMLASAERLLEIENFKENNENKKELNDIQAYYNEKFKSISLKNIEYTYYSNPENLQNFSKDNMPKVIKKINLEIKKGDYIAFVGHSGCGKSTILKILMCIYQIDSGERFIIDKGNNKEELTNTWQRLFAYVPQGNQLMSGTIREVVSFANRSEASNDKKIKQALKIACADEFVEKLENSIDTFLGEKGTGLSEGQIQRIAIARAIFSDSPILIFDESTSSLDLKTEKKIFENLKELTDKTVIIVTHRPAALKICNKIVEFSK